MHVRIASDKQYVFRGDCAKHFCGHAEAMLATRRSLLPHLLPFSHLVNRHVCPYDVPGCEPVFEQSLIIVAIKGRCLNAVMTKGLLRDPGPWGLQ